MIRKQFDSEVRAAGRGRVRRFVISTGTVDRDGDVIDPNGWQLENYRKNPVVLWAHDYSQLPIAKALDIHVEGQRLIADAEFAEHEFAATVLRLIDGGFLRATSVGFRPQRFERNTGRGGVDYHECELLEFSVVPVPANPQALRHIKAALWPTPNQDDIVLELDDDEAFYELEDIATAFRALAQEQRRMPADPPLDPAMRQHALDVMRGAVRDTVREIAREAAATAIARMRGRVD